MPHLAVGKNQPVFDFVGFVLFVGLVPNRRQVLSIIGMDGVEELLLGKRNIFRRPAPSVMYVPTSGKILRQPGLSGPAPRPNFGRSKRLPQAGYFLPVRGLLQVPLGEDPLEFPDAPAIAFQFFP